MEIIRDRERWNSVIYSFASWDVAHEWGYFEAYHQRNMSYEQLLFYHDSDYGKVAYPFFLRKVNAEQEFINDYVTGKYLTAVYGYTGPLVEGDNAVWQEFQEQFKEYLKENKINLIEEKFHPILKNDKKLLRNSEVSKKRDIVVIAPADEDALMKNYQRTSVKRGIKKAIKNGIVVKREGIETLENFMEIYYQTMDRNNAMEIYYFEEKFFETLADEFGNRMNFFNAYYEDQIIASNLYLNTPKIAYYFLGGQVAAYGKYQPISYIKHKAFSYYHEIKVPFINEGGGRTSDESDALFHFKSGFIQKNATIESVCPYYLGHTEIHNLPFL